MYLFFSQSFILDDLNYDSIVKKIYLLFDSLQSIEDFMPRIKLLV